MKPLNFWCQKVLPLVYDDSLSYYEVLCKLTRKINELISKFNNQPIDLSNYYWNNRAGFYADDPADINGRWIHVSTVGNDNNDGLTYETPVRTIRRAIELAIGVTNDVRIKVITSGTYSIDYLVYACNGLHINVKAPDVTLVYKHVGRHYMTHINFEGYSEASPTVLKCLDAENLFYLDGGSMVVDNFKFNCTVRLNDAGGSSFRTEFKSLLLFNSKFNMMYNMSFGEPTDERGAIYGMNSDIFISTPNLKCKLLENSLRPFLYLRGCRFTCTQVINRGSDFTYSENNIGQSVVLTSNSSMPTWKGFARANNLHPNENISNVTLVNN